MKNIAIYRCLFSDYDIALSELEVFKDIDYFLFTDNPSINVYPYRKIIVSSEKSTPSLKNRELKIILPDVLIPYDLTIYLDTNIRIVGNIRKLIDDFIASKSDIGLFMHPNHNTIEEEVELCLSKNKVIKSDIMNELEHYRNLSIPKIEKISDNSIIFRKKHHKKMREAMHHWFELVKNFSGRDQISLPFVRSLFDLNEYFFNFSARTRSNNYFIVFPHKINWKTCSFYALIKFYVKFNVKRVYSLFLYLKNRIT